jgi:DNA-binding SARP family transcriptional activator/tetratricopeptide (TPR) repeat protein
MVELAPGDESEQTVQAEPGRYDLKLFGEFRLVRDGVTIAPLRARSRQLLLAYLAINAGKVIDRSFLASILWPDSTEQQARTNLRHMLHSMRRALPEYSLIVTDTGTTLALREDAACTVDVSGFLDALDRAEKAGNEEVELQELQRAIASYAGELLPGHHNDWVLQERDRFERLYLAALERVAYLLASRRDYPAAMEYCHLLVALDPLRETAYQMLMRLHALEGNRAGVEQTYQTCVAVLDRELNIETSHQTNVLYQALIAGAAQSQWLDGPSALQMPAFVGRQSQWAGLARLWEEVDSGQQSRMVLLSGEAGIGKTRLADEFLHHLRRQGVTVLVARCYSAEGELSYAPVVAWLRGEPIASALSRLEEPWLAEVERLLPELRDEQPGTPRPPPASEGWQRQRFFEGLARAISSPTGHIALLIDDVQWCDRDTLEWLRFLLHFRSGSRLLLVATLRPEELTTDHPLLALVISLQRDGQLNEIMLDPLDEAGTTSLISSLAGQDVTPEQAHRIHRETEGNPLYIVEIVRSGQHVEDAETSLPPTIQAVMSGRLALLSPPALEIVRLAAVIGRTFNVAQLTAAGSMDEDQLIDALDELSQRRIVREDAGGNFDFTHDKLREVAYGQLGGTRRRLLHRRLARAMEQDQEPNTDVSASLLAHHFEQGGRGSRAIHYYLQAAKHARQVYANDDAERLFRRGLALVEGREVPKLTELSFLEGLGDVLLVSGLHQAARDTYQKILDTHAQHSNRQTLARIQRKLGNSLKSGIEFDEALAAYSCAEALLGETVNNLELWLDIQMDRMRVYYAVGDWQAMRSTGQSIWPELEQSGAIRQQVEFARLENDARLRQHRYVVSDEHLERVRAMVSLACQQGEPETVAEAKMSLGFCTLLHGDISGATELLVEVLQLARKTGHVELQLNTLGYLTIASRLNGQVEATDDFARRELSMATHSDMLAHQVSANASLAWLAWRRGDVVAAEESLREVIDIWQHYEVYPFQWLAIWPLVDILLGQGKPDDAIPFVKMLLDEMQQRLPDDLDILVRASLDANDPGHFLSLARDLAHELGYF